MNLFSNLFGKLKKADPTRNKNISKQHEQKNNPQKDRLAARTVDIEKDRWWFLPNGKQKSGPFTLEELRKAYLRESDTNKLAIRKDGDTDWVKWINAEIVFPALKPFLTEISASSKKEVIICKECNRKLRIPTLEKEILVSCPCGNKINCLSGKIMPQESTATENPSVGDKNSNRITVKDKNDVSKYRGSIRYVFLVVCHSEWEATAGEMSAFLHDRLPELNEQTDGTAKIGFLHSTDPLHSLDISAIAIETFGKQVSDERLYTYRTMHFRIEGGEGKIFVVYNHSLDSPHRGDHKYLCDICGVLTPGLETCTHFDQNRVLTSPAYWELVIQQKKFSEEVIGGFLGTFVNDNSGFYVCSKCKSMLENDSEQGEKYDLARYSHSIPNGVVDSHAAGMVAGSVFKILKGKWPNTIKIGTGSEPVMKIVDLGNSDKKG